MKNVLLKVKKKLPVMFALVLAMACMIVPAFASSRVADDSNVVLDEVELTLISHPVFGQLLVYDARLQLVVGMPYVVNYNGVSYTCVCAEAPSGIVDDPNSVAMGNFVAVGGPDTGEPFAILVTSTGVNVIDLTGSTSATLSITRPAVNFTRTFNASLDNEYSDCFSEFVPLVDGNDYIVNINGDSYTTSCSSFVNSAGSVVYILGNPKLSGSTESGVGDESMPFCLTSVLNGDSAISLFVVSSDYEGDVSYRVVDESLVPSVLGTAGNLVTALVDWVGSVSRMVINEPVLLIGFTIALATLAFGIFKSLKR